MLNTIWQIFIWILSICGILLLSVICLLLLLVLLALFVPIRYRGEGQKDINSIYAKLKISWLFQLFRIEMQYQNKILINRVKILFFCIYDSSKPPKEKRKKKKSPPAESTIPKDDSPIKDDPHPLQDTTLETEEKEENRSTPISEPYSEEVKPQSPPSVEEHSSDNNRFLSWLERILQKFKNILYTLRHFCAKIKKAWENIDYYIQILQSDETRNVFVTCKALLGKGLKSILPNKINANLKVGTGSPDTTGYLLALMGMLYPHFGNNVSIEPDFENLILEGSLYFKGRVLLFTLAIIALKIYRNKELRSLIRKLKREET